MPVMDDLCREGGKEFYDCTNQKFRRSSRLRNGSVFRSMVWGSTFCIYLITSWSPEEWVRILKSTGTVGHIPRSNLAFRNT